MVMRLVKLGRVYGLNQRLQTQKGLEVAQIGFNKVNEQKKRTLLLCRVRVNRDIDEIIWENVVYRHADLKGLKFHLSNSPSS